MCEDAGAEGVERGEKAEEGEVAEHWWERELGTWFEKDIASDCEGRIRAPQSVGRG